MKAPHSKNGYSSVWFLLMVVGIFIMVGCGGGGGGGTPTPSGTPSIALSTDSIQYPGTVLGQTSEKWVTIENNGTADLAINSVSDPGDACFTVSTTCSTLAQGDTCDVVVQFTPTEQKAYSSSFSIGSNASNAPSLTVNLNGEGKGLNVSIDQVDTSAHPDIRLLVTVTKGADDEPVEGLINGYFSVFEQGIAQTLAEPVRYIPTSPLAISLALDYSGSIEDYQDEVEQSTVEFIDTLRLVIPPADEAAVIKFAKDVQVMGTLGTFTSDYNFLISRVEAPYTGSMEGTNFYDAVYKSAELVGQHLDTKLDYRGVAIVLSDGLQVGSSTYTLEQAIAKAREEWVTVYTIGFGDDFLQRPILQQIAEETNGRYLEAPTKTEIRDVYLQISSILGNQYEIIFETTLGESDSLVELKVAVEDDSLPVLKGEATEVVQYQ
jgi:VWFA-related protein